ncbi:MAG: 2-oxo acid dehydrogenase subunit E2 [Limisphaerales bacterium]
MDVKLPNLGEGTDSGTVVSVLVKAGAAIKKGQNLIELETGKAVTPIPAPAAGVVEKLAVKEGDKLGVGGLILVLKADTAGAPAVEAPKAAAAAAPRTLPRARPTATVATARPLPAALPAEVPEAEPVLNDSPAAGPYVRKIAHDLGIPLECVPGTGVHGLITIPDLRQYVANLRGLAYRPLPEMAAATAAPARPTVPLPDFAAFGPVRREALTAMRKAIAERMVASATTLPTVTQFDEADLTALNDLRKKHAPAYEARGARLTVTSFVLKAVAAVLRKHPIFNASLDEAAGEIVFKDYVHLGLAVDTEAGLLVPVIRDADKKDLVQLSKDIAEAAVKARDRKLALADMQGQTFTISNQGGIGGAHFTPIINLPDAAILGLGRSVLKPVVRDGQIVPRLLMPVALTYDHRLIDGGAAARFTVDLVAALESFTEADVKL